MFDISDNNYEHCGLMKLETTGIDFKTCHLKDCPIIYWIKIFMDLTTRLEIDN